MMMRVKQVIMSRIAGASFETGVGDSQEFRRWCAALGETQAICDEMLARISPEQVTVNSFDLDQLEVTRGAFASWLNTQLKSGSATIAGAKIRRGPLLDLALPNCDDGMNGMTISAGEVRVSLDPERAAACLTYEAAVEYCRDQGKRLPTGAEWSLAAGGTAHRVLPWEARTLACNDAVYGRDAGGPCSGSPGPDVVSLANKDVTSDGVRALGGNVSEWVDAPIDDPKHVGRGESVARGGSWAGLAIDLHPAKLMWLGPGPRKFAGGSTVGFRCARDVR